MNQLAERCENLVVEAAKTRGTAFAFRDPLWVTWPLSRFCTFPGRGRDVDVSSRFSLLLFPADGLQDLTTPYLHSLFLIRSLLDTLTTFPPLPCDDDATKQTGEEKRERPKPEEIQAAMSLLAVQPLIPGKGGEGPEAWEETMCVEVGGWGEGRS
jgi:hypothetical protein